MAVDSDISVYYKMKCIDICFTCNAMKMEKKHCVHGPGPSRHAEMSNGPGPIIYICTWEATSEFVSYIITMLCTLF